MKSIGDLLTANIKVVKHHPYRTAAVTDHLFSHYYARNDGTSRLHEHLIAQVNQLSSPDNHECFEITVGGKTYYVMFSDWNCILGKKIHINQRVMA